MAKALRTAAFVVGAAALIVATGGAASAGFAAAFASTVGISATAFATIASAVAAGLSFAGTALAPKPGGTLGGNATKFKIDKDAGLPYAIGRTAVGGNVVHRQYYGTKNSLESWVTVLSIGPIASLGALLIDKVPVSFPGGAATGTYAGSMWLDEQLGAQPEASALTGPSGAIPGWGASSKLSGLAADLWTLKFDEKGKKYPNGVPQRLRVVEGVKVYDARLDSTFPGGSGSCRLGDESTYVYSENPACHAVTWAYGRYQNGSLIAGGGMAVKGIDLQPFVEWSNICDANGWKVGGLVYTNSDNSWDVLQMIAQAGGGEVMPVGALLSCTFSAPRVSIGTITSNDIAGDIDVPASASRRLRRNTVIPRVRLESQGWEVVPLDAIEIDDYIAVDGGRRPKEIDFPLVQQADQAAELGLYAILNARELDPISLPCKIYMLGYRPGDCLTVDVPEGNLIDREVVLRTRELDTSTMGVAFTCRTETAGKHDFALGRTGTPPPTPDLSIPTPDLDAPDAADWDITGGALSANGQAIPALIVTGSVANPNADAVIFEYRPFVTGQAEDDGWAGASFEPPQTVRKEITSVAPETSYEVSIRYRVRGLIGDRLILGPVTAGSLAVTGANASFSATVTGNDVMNTSFASVPYPVVTVPANASGEIQASLSLSYRVDNWTGGTKGWQGEFKFAYRPAGTGAWSDFSDGVFQGGYAEQTPIEADESGAAATLTQAGLVANAGYDIGLFVRKHDGTAGTSARLYGQITGRAP